MMRANLNCPAQERNELKRNGSNGNAQNEGSFTLPPQNIFYRILLIPSKSARRSSGLSFILRAIFGSINYTQSLN